ncbi:HAD family hydrolase [Roseofilum capinflatum]|uniref:HAD family hydrolase n=1 Tax=Roseofilum capinflatum BLCC-M114 TaxID=3022440 RepID=A0ABT7B9N0_9CYAN|nr:HAD family hydrolase [Roseofilum capinflatum]MDJ1175871.1 HAD family hydrolase [Roseofilum capinflatum BLCC-M114]
MEAPDVLALDFDGVLCDGLVEYFQTAWQTYTQVWMVGESPPPKGMAEQFYRLRPVIETGWEMPVLIRAMVEGSSEDDILDDWRTICDQIISRDGLKAGEIMDQVDGRRDRQIQTSRSDWLALHQFYPGITPQLRSLLANPNLELAIITTKEARFAQELLQMENIDFPGDRIIGKSSKRPKTETLLTFNPSEKRIWFIEDRWKTLLSVAQHPQLTSVELFLATWGYNTAAEKQAADSHPRIHSLSLDTFSQPLNQWPIMGS